MNLHRTILGVGALTLALLASPVMAEQLRPFDEGPRDPSFATFRAKLLAAIKRRAYIRPNQYYSAVGYRARFAKHAGRWRIKYFLAGD